LTLALLISLHHLSFLSLLPSLEHASKLLSQHIILLMLPTIKYMFQITWCLVVRKRKEHLILV
jgi:hypothetical protein